ncbi:MAG: glycosyltransferase [Thermodesulfobacteriota bacterium]
MMNLPELKIAYFFSTFPHLNTTFLQREVRGLNSVGLFPLLAANRPPATGAFHPGDRDLVDGTFYLNPVRPLPYLKANLGWLVRHPRRYLRAIGLALKVTDAFPGQRFRNLARLAGAAVLAEHLRNNRVVHVHVHFAFGAAGVAMLLETLSGIPYSISIHGSDVLLPQPMTFEKLRRARFVVSNCRYHVNFLRRRFPALGRQRFFVVPLGLSVSQPPWRTVVPPAPIPPLRILNVARFDPVKGHELLLEACSRLRDLGIPFVCRLVGDGPIKTRISRLIEAHGLAGRVAMTGPLFEAEVARQFDWCHVMVLSSRSEGTPMTVIEAMAKGRAVVAPDMTGLPEMVITGETGLLYPRNDPAALADCLARLSQDPERMVEMGAAGRRHAEKRYEAATNTRILERIFREEIKMEKP